MAGNNTNSLFFSQILIYVILIEVRNSKGKSSTDFNDLCMFTIKEIILEMSHLSKNVLNRPTEDIFRNIKKKSKFIPLFKSGDKSVAE